MKKPSNRLTQKQDRFCAEYVATGNASEAYRRAYSAAGMKPETVNRSANALLNNHKVTARLTALRTPVVAKAQITLEAHLDALLELRDDARQADNFGAAITAEVSRGKASGLYDIRLLHRRDTVSITAGILQRVLDRTLSERDAGLMLEIQGIPLPEILKIQLSKQAVEDDAAEAVAITPEELERRYLEAEENKALQIEIFKPDRAAQVIILKEKLEGDSSFQAVNPE
jgi:phage terminase small subunit